MAGAGASETGTEGAGTAPWRQPHEAALRAVADAGEGEIDIAGAALALAALERPQVDLARYREHLQRLVAETREAAPRGNDLGGNDLGGGDLAARAAALGGVIAGSHGYMGDALNYDDLQNANLIRVIDRRKGLPVALGILYLHVARAQGWPASGIAFPGHFLIALGGGEAAPGTRVILDPFHGGVSCDAQELRSLLKAVSGTAAELQPEHYAPVSDRSVLLRLQNNVKLRLARSGRHQEALQAVERMLLFAPERAELWREAALLHAQLGNIRAAIAALETCLSRERGDGARHEAAALLQRLRMRLN